MSHYGRYWHMNVHSWYRQLDPLDRIALAYVVMACKVVAHVITAYGAMAYIVIARSSTRRGTRRGALDNAP